MKITSAYANKLLKSLADEKSYWEAQEAASRTYVAAVGEEPVIPEYDYSAVSETPMPPQISWSAIRNCVSTEFW